MLYRLLRAVAAIALRWYYADIGVQGAERVPQSGPLLVVANHPNALIDPLVVGTTLSRRILITAKATLFERRPLAALLHAVGVVPLRRAKDEYRDEQTAAVAPDRNAEAFRSVTSALRRGAAVLIFPEGISHDDPALAPLRSGAARMAIQAHTDGVSGIRLLAVGLNFEEKERPGSRVLVRFGDPLVLESWLTEHRPDDIDALTQTIETRLRAVTLNFASAERASRAVRIAGILSALATEPLPVAQSRSLGVEADLALRIDRATTALADAPADVMDVADQLSARLSTLEHELDQLGIGLDDIRISIRWTDATRFVLREGPIFLLAVVAFVLGWVTHWIPLWLARAFALRSLRRDPSRDQPAMRTIILGLLAIVIWYAAQAVILALLVALPAAIGWLV
jgi:glycerol-3-phosphate O-acyltransferase/dihydroxyacetone phosphate acyltransferase